ncbi:hypothetical protein [Flavihumibacter petaseus]|uniref:DUF2975 domain-containing protein n=1 Tax=Flavihumibacter petaseus NBRC 106054 TaxID=1220578 RepID=A0A0E9MX33_9BACT|nr:hypothetical protein [Flavihumibacter petaseus]GAO41680.1 hypothetical protein FPE01S_01_06940 [Flavihumibacter petaseus NBRC 106054]
MQQAKIISRCLFYFSRFLSVGYLFSVAYALLCIVTGWFVQPYGDNKFLHINYPFTSRPFLNVDNNLPYIIFSFILPLLLYGIFFWLSSNVFRVFFQSRLFTTQNIVQLKRFYVFDIFIPFPAVLLAGFFVPLENAIWVLVLVHGFLGIFVYFLAVIFRQGLYLQNEQDLFI